MFIEIDYSCIEKFDQNEIYITFFNELAYEIYKGRNYYYIPKKALEFLYQCTKLDNQPKEIYKKMFDNSYEELAIKNSVNRMLIIENKGKKELYFENDIYRINIDTFIDMGLPSKINIIGENNSDCKFLTNIGKAYKYKKNLKAVNIELINVPGGGATISDIYINKIMDKEFSILFIDTDKKYENAPLGGTIRSLKQAKRKAIRENLPIELVKIKELDVHEIENLIPLKMIENYYSIHDEETSKKDVIDFLKKFENDTFNSQNPIVFFDMKKGIIRKKCEDNEIYKNYWKNVLETNGYVYDEENLIGGFGDHLLRKIESYLEKNVENESFWDENINLYIKDVWEEIGKLIYSYGCARIRKVC